MTTRIEGSLHLILSCERQRLGHLFYEEFFSACPEAVPFFANMNLDAQAKVVINGLQAIVACKVHRYPAVDSYLVLLGNRHHRRNIPQSIYPAFRDSMLKTLAIFHASDWDTELESEWRIALDLAIEVMSRGYLVEHLSY